MQHPHHAAVGPQSEFRTANDPLHEPMAPSSVYNQSYQEGPPIIYHRQPMDVQAASPQGDALARTSWAASPHLSSSVSPSVYQSRGRQANGAIHPEGSGTTVVEYPPGCADCCGDCCWFMCCDCCGDCCRRGGCVGCCGAYEPNVIGVRRVPPKEKAVCSC